MIRLGGPTAIGNDGHGRRDSGHGRCRIGMKKRATISGWADEEGESHDVGLIFLEQHRLLVYR